MLLIRNFYHNKIFEKIFPTLVFFLKKELRDCKTVLDLGCGFDSPFQYCKNIDYSVGVEFFEKYLKISKEKKIHSEYIKELIQKIYFKENSFDAVILLEVLEHLNKEDALEIIQKAKVWARKKVIISTPNGFIGQKEIDGNILQKHLSGWTLSDLNELGFRCHGLAGLKFLRHEKDENTMDDNLLVSIKYKPKFFWFIISVFSQSLVYLFPKFSFGLFCVYENKDSN